MVNFIKEYLTSLVMLDERLESMAIYMMKAGNKVGLNNITDHRNRIALPMLMNLKAAKFEESFALAAKKVGICQNVFAEVMGTTIKDHYCEDVVIEEKPHILTIAQYENGLFYAIPIDAKNGIIPMMLNPEDIEAGRNPFPYDFSLPILNPDVWESPGYRKEDAVKLPNDGVRSRTTDLKYFVGQNQITVLLESSDITFQNSSVDRDPKKSHHIRTAWLYCPEEKEELVSAFQVYIQKEDETWIYCYDSDSSLKLVSRNNYDGGKVVYHKPSEVELSLGIDSIEASQEMMGQIKEVFDTCYPRMFHDKVSFDATIRKILATNKPELRSYLG